MKFLLVGSLSVLLVSAASAPSLRAETAVRQIISNSTANESQLTPFNLVSLAYQGYFRDQGVPSYGALLSGYKSGKITAEELVQSAVKKNRLSSQVLADRGFLRAVEDQLFKLSID